MTDYLEVRVTVKRNGTQVLFDHSHGQPVFNNEDALTKFDGMTEELHHEIDAMLSIDTKLKEE